MNSYDYELNLFTENSNKKIIEHIKPNSKILEFGPAHGRLTRYLSEQLACVVDIVEYNKQAGLDAAKFARHALVGEENGEIESYCWKQELGRERYDYIIFADVLEHLRDPEQVLKECSIFLKDGGQILCSIPNIAHSSVIISLLNDEFCYTQDGLLDKTHIHFFTKKSFRNMAEQSGYKIILEDVIRSKVGTNEIPYNYSDVDNDVENILRLRSNGEAYQYIFVLMRDGDPQADLLSHKNITLSSAGWDGICLIKTGEYTDFAEESKIVKKIGKYYNDIYFDVNGFEEIHGVCSQLLPVPACLKLIKLEYVCSGKTYLVNDISHDGVKIGENIYVFTEAPPRFYFVPCVKKIDFIHVIFEIMFINGKALSQLKQISELNKNTQLELEELNLSLDNLLCKSNESQEKLLGINKNLEENIKQAEQKVKIMEDLILDLKAEINNKQVKYEAYSRDYQQLKSEYDSLEKNKIQLELESQQMTMELSELKKSFWYKLSRRGKK